MIGLKIKSISSDIDYLNEIIISKFDEELKKNELIYQQIDLLFISQDQISYLSNVFILISSSKEIYRKILKK